MNLCCPICNTQLNQVDRQYCCPNRHSFDVARQGYVNLLTVQQKHSRNPSDTRQQVLARRSFLEQGFYRPIVDALVATARELGCQGPVLDVGCGEGYYSSRLADALRSQLLGLDISKEAVRCAAGSYKNATWVCTTASKLPVRDHSVGLLTSLFALTVPGEFHRVLAKDGYYFQVLAAQDHLMALKKIIYPEILLREKDSVPVLPGFVLVKSVPIRFTFTAQGEAVQQLLSMTPHVYRISKSGAQALAETQTLTDTASCVLNVYQAV